MEQHPSLMNVEANHTGPPEGVKVGNTKSRGRKTLHRGKMSPDDMEDKALRARRRRKSKRNDIAGRRKGMRMNRNQTRKERGRVAKVVNHYVTFPRGLVREITDFCKRERKRIESLKSLRKERERVTGRRSMSSTNTPVGGEESRKPRRRRLGGGKKNQERKSVEKPREESKQRKEDKKGDVGGGEGSGWAKMFG